MAWSVVQKRSNTPSTAALSQALAFTGNLASSSNLLVVGVSASGASLPTLSVTDSASNTYTELLTSTETGDNQRASVFTAPITAGVGTAPTVTVHGSVSASYKFAIFEVSGIQNAIDKSATNNATTSPTNAVSGQTAATTAASEWAVAVYGDSGIDTSLAIGGTSETPSSGWTDDGTTGNNASQNGSIQHVDSGASGTQIQAAWTSSGSPYAALVAVFKLAAAQTASWVPQSVAYRRRAARQPEGARSTFFVPDNGLWLPPRTRKPAQLPAQLRMRATRLPPPPQVPVPKPVFPGRTQARRLAALAKGRRTVPPLEQPVAPSKSGVSRRLVSRARGTRLPAPPAQQTVPTPSWIPAKLGAIRRLIPAGRGHQVVPVPPQVPVPVKAPQVLRSLPRASLLRRGRATNPVLAQATAPQTGPLVPIPRAQLRRLAARLAGRSRLVPPGSADPPPTPPRARAAKAPARPGSRHTTHTLDQTATPPSAQRNRFARTPTPRTGRHAETPKTQDAPQRRTIRVSSIPGRKLGKRAEIVPPQIPVPTLTPQVIRSAPRPSLLRRGRQVARLVASMLGITVPAYVSPADDAVFQVIQADAGVYQISAADDAVYEVNQADA